MKKKTPFKYSAPSAKSSVVQESSSALALPPEVGAFEAKTHLSALLAKVGQGQSFIITKHGKAIAELKPPSAPVKQARMLGQWAGKKFWMAPDFDAPLDDFKEYME